MKVPREAESVIIKMLCLWMEFWEGGQQAGLAIAGGWGLADGEACVGVDFGYFLGPQAVVVGVCVGHDGVSSLSIVGKVGLVAESPLEEAVGNCGLSRASNWTAPEAAELGCLDGITGHWNFEELGLDMTAAGNVGVRRRIWRLHLRIFFSSASCCLGFGGMN